MYAICKASLKKGNEKDMNHLGIDVGKRKCRAVAIKDDKGQVLDEFFFGNDRDGVHNLLSRIRSHGKCSTRAVLESTENMWMRIHDTLEDNGIDTVLASPYKSKIIAEERVCRTITNVYCLGLRKYRVFIIHNMAFLQFPYP